MNLMEITKGYEPKQNEQQEQMKNLSDTTDKWKLLAKEQATSLELVTKERDELQVRNQKMNEFILEFQKRTHSLKMEKQQLFFENHEMQEEMQKSNAEIQQMTEELSEMRKLNQSLQQSNDDLRNRNGLMTRSEQEQLEEEIKDVRNQNSKLKIRVNQSSVEAVEQAQQKQEEAEKQARQAENQAERERKQADVEIQRARRKAKSEVEDMRERQFFWDWGYLCVIFFSFIQNGAFQRDLLQLITVPINWCRGYVAWFEQLDYIGYSAGEVIFERIFSSAVIMAGIVGCVLLVWGGIEQYRKIWDEIYKMVLIASISFIVVLGNLIREYLPFNLLFVILVINVGAVLIRIYLNNKNVGY
ncbi:Acyl-CoA cholesterol acyltransferase [uncultured Clostridium sp.]|nr:Acyl-CoA cholesterol acyltransferase [uncultured Clostridium sp.]